MEVIQNADETSNQEAKETVEGTNSSIVPKKDEKLIINLKTQIPDIDNIFNIHRKIGHGTFSSVFLGSLKCHERLAVEKRKLFAIKHIIPTSHPNRIERELKCLMQIGGSDNVVGVDLCLRKHESVAFVMPYIPHDKFHEYFDKMTAAETQQYMRNLLVALKRVHSFNIIHRDVKPSNFLYNRKLKKFLLVDFGLAQDISKKIADSTAMAGTSAESTKRRLSDVDPASVNLSNNQQKRSRLTSVSSTSSSAVAVVKADNVENSNNSTTDVPNQSQNVPSPFKTPLKQSNQIMSPMKSFKVTKDLYNSPLARQVKSTVLGISLNMKLAQKHASPIPSMSTPKSTTYNTDRKADKSPSICYCYGKSMVCNICLVKKEIQASRAGTPGYRPPEVLLKYSDQNTVVDMWAAGVMFLTILSKCYPFFKNSDDFQALAEIITIFGDNKIKKTAYQLGRHVKTGHKKLPLDLRKLCLRLRNRFNAKAAPDPNVMVEEEHDEKRVCDNCQQKPKDCLCEGSDTNRDFSGDVYTANAYDLLIKLLEINPKLRISAEDALNHQFFQETY